ncbi:Spo11/DNA topoisomerase VI subunit A [Syncephalastrum racemosum]|uniref:DNA topoisomerase (ATP-hydrolyzing) n=1 Tax=Syncephalastrum racemosum TaxID=13706 RepID=A0A1X2H087_SYNRA|nr:Spo11/DNA topoisomerase VI subunit A [Syncephalastrum racemosum]
MDTQNTFVLENASPDSDMDNGVESVLTGIDAAYRAREDIADTYFVVPDDTFGISSFTFVTQEGLLPPPLTHTCVFESSSLRQQQAPQDDLYSPTDGGHIETTGSPCTQPQPREAMMEAIEAVIVTLIEQLVTSQRLELPPYTHSRKRRPTQDAEGEPESSRPISIRNRKESKQFARYLRVLDIIHESLSRNEMVSKREIYYRDVNLFKTQDVINKIIDNLSRYYNVPRSSLHVTTAVKGILQGAAKITLKNDRVIDCAHWQRDRDSDYCSDEQGVLIPPMSDVKSVHCTANLILIIEKESTFRHLISANFFSHFPHALILTGRGYPDLATRSIVNYLSRITQAGFYCLTDFDPYGIEIYSVYKWGSKVHDFDAPNLTMPRLELLGLSRKDLHSMIPEDEYVPLTQADRKKILDMLQACMAEVEGKTRYKILIQELNTMLYFDIKCEMEVLWQTSLGITGYLKKKLELRS